MASTTMMLGRSQQSAGNYHDAARSYEEALSLYRELAEKEPQEVRYQDGIASTLNNLGYLSSEREKLEEAIKYHEEAVAIHQRLVNDEPENAGRKYRLSVSYGNLGNRLTLLSRFNDALAAHNKRLVLLRELAQQHGLRKEYDEQFGDTFNNIGDVYRQNRSEPGWFENGIAAYTESRAIQERIVKDHPKSLQAQSKLANTLINTGQVYEWHKDHVEALQAFDVATVLLEKIVGTNPQGANDLSSLGMSYARKGRALVALARKEEAVAPYEKAVASHKRLVGLVPSNQRYKQELDSFQRELARAKK